MAIRATVWNEYIHERLDPAAAAVYPEGIHACIADALRAAGIEARTAVLDEPWHGLTTQVLDETDVLFWWGHRAHDSVGWDVVEDVCRHVQDGMGLVVLHSGHDSRVFHRLMGMDTGRLRWRENGEKEILWVTDPGHPIARGIGSRIVVPHAETYGEHFNIPAPDELVFLSWFEGGEVFRSGCCWTRGCGRIFYFRPGHETYPVYYQPDVRQVLVNAALWAAKSPGRPHIEYGRSEPAVQE